MTAARRRDDAARRASSTAPAHGGPDRNHAPFRSRTSFDETVTLPAGPLRRVVCEGRLDDAATLVLGRPDDLLEKRVGHAIGIMPGIDDQEVHGADEAAGTNRRPQGQDGPTDDLATNLGHEDACLREIDQLSEQVTGVERPVSGAPNGAVAQGDEPLDVRDAGGSDQVFHAGECHLTGPAERL